MEELYQGIISAGFGMLFKIGLIIGAVILGFSILKDQLPNLVVWAVQAIVEWFKKPSKPTPAPSPNPVPAPNAPDSNIDSSLENLKQLTEYAVKKGSVELLDKVTELFKHLQKAFQGEQK